MFSLRQSSAMLSSPRRPDKTIRIFSSEECSLRPSHQYCVSIAGQRYARRISFTTCSAGVFVVTGFFIIFNSIWGKDEPQTLRYAITLNCSMGADGGQTHHVNILEMNGDSYRLGQSKARQGKA